MTVVPLSPVLLTLIIACCTLFLIQLAFVLGMLPMVMASGPGSASRHSIGTGVFFGMLVATTVGIVLVPFFFILIYKIKDGSLWKELSFFSFKKKRFIPMMSLFLLAMTVIMLGAAMPYTAKFWVKK